MLPTPIPGGKRTAAIEAVSAVSDQHVRADEVLKLGEVRGGKKGLDAADRAERGPPAPARPGQLGGESGGGGAAGRESVHVTPASRGAFRPPIPRTSGAVSPTAPISNPLRLWPSLH